jgi:hypothetical protein
MRKMALQQIVAREVPPPALQSSRMRRLFVTMTLVRGDPVALLEAFEREVRARVPGWSRRDLRRRK